MATPDQALATQLRNIEAKTGRDPDPVGQTAEDHEIRRCQRQRDGGQDVDRRAVEESRLQALEPQFRRFW